MEPEEKKSKSQVKREMHDLQKLSERLVSLSEHQLEKIDMPDELRQAVLLAQTIKSYGARKRQSKYIGALMRQVDPEVIRRSLDEIDGNLRTQIYNFHEIERLRDDLIEDNPAVMEKVLSRFPQVERQRLMQLVRGARKEKQLNKSPRSYRALFAYLRDLSEE